MTISEAHVEFKVRYDKVDSLNYPNYEPEEIDLILNKAQDITVKQRYGFNNVKRTSLEETQKRIEDLRNIIRTKAVLVSDLPDEENLSFTNTYNANLEEDHWFVIWEKAIIRCASCTTEIRVPILPYSGDGPTPAPDGGGGGGVTSIGVTGTEVEVRPTTHLELEKVKKDAFKKADKTKILRLMYRNRVELISSTGCPVIYYIYRYIKKPNRVDITGGITFELSDHMHTEIIDTAVSIALESAEAKRTGTFKQYIDNLKE